MKMLNNKTCVYILLFFLIVSSCSTKKKTLMHRKYHNITARYNGYFNAKESLKYGILKLEKAHKDDYSNILPVYKHGNITSSTSHHAYMDKSIKKGSIVIQNHSINIRNKEYCKWIDDSYFLVAKSYYFKGQFLEAKKTFEFIKKKWKKTELALESELWMAKCYLALGDYQTTENILDELQSKKNFRKELDRDLHLTLADLYLNQGMYSDAADELKSACRLVKRKSKKARYLYIIAQVYQDAGNVNLSKKYFELVLNSNAEYEMVFNAKMNLARTLRSKKDLSQMRSSLKKMIKDEKNKDYLDQIYFTIAEMDIVDKDSVSAIENYTLSTKYSLNNDIQKSISFLRLGKIYYNKSDYISSKTFYDSAYTFMPEDHHHFEETKKTQKTLEKLVDHLTTISLEDSLQMLSGLSDLERREIIQSVIAEVVRKEREEQIEKQNRANRGMLERGDRNGNFGSNTSGGKWYFYNPATLSYGLSEFRKKWGKRKLEDDWRRANKKTLSTFDGDSTTTDKTKNQKNKDLKSEQYYLDQIPITKKQIAESNTKIINAYYQSSLIYRDDLEEMRKSENMLESLVKRFPNHEELTPLSYYLIYNLQMENNSISKSNKTKQTLIDKFPKSNYAKTLLDSNYIKSVIDEKTKIESEYNKIHSYYLKDSFEQSLYHSTIKLNESSTEENSKYHPKYFLINILSEFKLNKDTVKFIKNLEKGVSKYPNTNTSNRCGDLLSILKNTKGLDERNITATLKTPYRYQENAKHYLLILCPKEGVDINYIKTIVSDFNTKNYSVEKLEINTMLMGLEQHILIVKTFQNTSSVSVYEKTLFTSQELLNELNKTTFKKIIISQQNFIEFYKNKDVEGYSVFFDNNYLEDR